MKIKNAKQIKISVAHRLGTKRSDGKPRPIIVTIHDSSDFSLIMKNTPNVKQVLVNTLRSSYLPQCWRGDSLLFLNSKKLKSLESSDY